MKYQQTDKQRVVITGIGMISPLGKTVLETWKNLLKGTSGIQPVSAFDTSSLGVHHAGEIEDFAPSDTIKSCQIKNCGRASQLAIVASHQALQSSQMPPEQYDPFRCGVSFGTTMGEPGVFDQIIDTCVEKGIEQVPLAQWHQLPSTNISNHISATFGWYGPNQLFPTACAAGNYAIGHAADLLRLKKVDAMLVGGSDALSRIAFVGFHKLRAMAPEYVAPFDLHRKGMMIGEGSAALLMERLSDAKARKAPIYAEFLSYGLGCDAHKMTIPHPQGLGGQRALEQALFRAGIKSNQIDHISAHGTGTPENDRIETMIIKKVLGKHAHDCPITAIKSMTGHCMGASSAIEALVSCLSLKYGKIPPTINYQTPDPECDLDYTPNQLREQKISIVASNAYAFGGNASSIILRAFE